MLSYFITNTFPFPTQLKNINVFINSDSLEPTLHVITIQFRVLCLTREQRGSSVTAQVKKRLTSGFNLKAANVNTNIFFL